MIGITKKMRTNHWNEIIEIRKEESEEVNDRETDGDREDNNLVHR
jgi:hypothetical protein